MKIIKKDGRIESFNFDKIKAAVNKSAARVEYKVTNSQWKEIEREILHLIQLKSSVSVTEMHGFVERTLNQIIPDVGQAYSDYRNYKRDYAEMMTSVLNSADELNYKIDRSNANTTAALISTQRSLISPH